MKPKKTTIVVVCFICSTLLLQPPRLSLSADNPVSAVVAIISLISFFRSGTDPTLSSVLQNRELIKQLNKGFEAYGTAVKLLLRKIDMLPVIVREEIKKGFDEYQEDKIRGVISLIDEDMKILKEGGALDGSQLYRRLDALQFEARTLAERSDLSLPFLILAMRYELALLEYLESRGQNKEVNKRVRERKYYERLREMLNIERAGSLVYVFDSLDRFLKIQLSLIEGEFNSIRARNYERTWRPGDGHCIDGKDLDREALLPCHVYCVVVPMHNSDLAKIQEIVETISHIKENGAVVYTFYYELIKSMGDLSPIYADKSSFSGPLSITNGKIWAEAVVLYPYANSDTAWYINESHHSRLKRLNKLEKNVKEYRRKAHTLRTVTTIFTPPPPTWVGCP